MGQTLNTLVNVGVIAGIIFLACELNQTYSSMRSAWEGTGGDAVAAG